MDASAAPTSGTDALDGLVDQVHIGDNLVVLSEGGALLDLLVERYRAAAEGLVPLVLVTMRSAWRGPVPAGVEVLDWSAVLTSQPTELPHALPPDARLEDALADLRAADERVGTGAVFAFDRLSAVQSAWSDEAALELFLATCPRLYRRRSLALWPLELEAHRPSFLRRLTEITQVVVEITRPAHADGDAFTLTVRKADGRTSEVQGRSRAVRVVDGDLEAVGDAMTTRQRLGTVIRDQRLASGLAQAEVARRVGISPSALSQVERGVRGPGGDTLMRLWEVLGVPFGPRQTTTAGYRIARRSGREQHRLQEGLDGELLLHDATAGELWSLQVAPGTRGDQGPFDVKVAESVTVVRGVIDLQLAGRTETLHEGDALHSDLTPIDGWSNPSSAPAELVWVLHGPRT